ncbi:MAG: TatD family hydrolase [Candidatus Lokiarchaeota archaeon]|nr:TatD family hydrolase [Candidatus Lokiarchaeota archaeon]
MLIDVHCHTNLYLELDKVLEEAKKVNIEKIISVGMSNLGLERTIEIAHKYKMIYPALGIHPEETLMNKNIENQLDNILEFIFQNSNKICAIGEIGLDHHFIKDKNIYPLQEKIFLDMLDLAQKLNLPVNLHTKGAEQEIFEILPSFTIPNVNIHWYSGPDKYLKFGIERGYYFSITPAISYSPVIKKVVELVDLNHLLLESDGPVNYSGKVGSPSMIRNVLAAISSIKNISKKELEEKIYQNTKIIFPKLF